MRTPSYVITLILNPLFLSACSVFGSSGVQHASYAVDAQDGNIEVRDYYDLVVVSTPLNGDLFENREAFNRLFAYISGANQSGADMDMTAPVLLDSAGGSGVRIDMTAPVIVDRGTGGEDASMSFVLPENYNYDTAPRPTDPAVELRRIANLTVAAITFNGRLNRSNTDRYRQRLEQWIDENGYELTGAYKVAGYDPPWTLPAFRRNEILIPISKVRDRAG